MLAGFTTFTTAFTVSADSKYMKAGSIATNATQAKTLQCMKVSKEKFTKFKNKCVRKMLTQSFYNFIHSRVARMMIY